MRVSRRRSLEPSRPMHALRNASSALRWRLSELTTSVPGLTSGALSMYESSVRTGYSGRKSFAPAERSRYWTRVRSSVRIVRSRMRGVARRESYVKGVGGLVIVGKKGEERGGRGVPRTR